MSTYKYPEFKAPNSYIIPDGVQEGETFEDIATFRVKPDGQICITKIGEASLDEEGKGDDKGTEEPADYGTSDGMNSRLTEAFKQRG